MKYIALFILVFTLIQFVVAFVNLLTQTHLPRKGNTPGKKVSVLIPTRNEERNISSLLSDLENQTYSNFDIAVFNDNSEDRTADIVNEFKKGGFQ
jgi:cellulose synthase/poly-beta-1,6-N-acetylglucosamine synthase-like glycosyltransferase